MFYPGKALILTIVVGVEIRGIVEWKSHRGAAVWSLVGFTPCATNFFPVGAISRDAVDGEAADPDVLMLASDCEEARLATAALAENGILTISGDGSARVDRARLATAAEEAGVRVIGHFDALEPAGAVEPGE